MMYNVVDLFAGAGGLSVGAEAAGFDVVFANDFEKYMCETYKLNHVFTEVFCGDILDISNDFILNNLKPKNIHVVCGGPPCQGFSTVGQKKEDDPRNSLFIHFFRFVELLDPEFVLFENVSGFKRLYKSRAFNAVCEKLYELGYSVVSDILNAAEYGVPQIRKRAIIIGYKPVYKIKMPDKLIADENFLTLFDALGDLPNAGEAEYGLITHSYQRDRRKNETVVTYHDLPKYGERLTTVIKSVPYGGTIVDVDESLRPNSYFKNTYGRLWWDRPANTITSNFGTPSSSRCIHPFQDRALTAREACRLQSFDDGYKFYGNKRYIHLQIGNAMPPLLAKCIFEELKKASS